MLLVQGPHFEQQRSAEFLQQQLAVRILWTQNLPGQCHLLQSCWYGYLRLILISFPSTCIDPKMLLDYKLAQATATQVGYLLQGKVILQWTSIYICFLLSLVIAKLAGKGYPLDGDGWESFVPRIYKELLRLNSKIKRCSTPIIIREAQIKTTVRHYCIPLGWL